MHFTKDACKIRVKRDIPLSTVCLQLVPLKSIMATIKSKATRYGFAAGGEGLPGTVALISSVVE